MAAFVFFAVLCVAVSAAPPAPPRLYQQHAPAQLQQMNSLDYYLDNPEVHTGYYTQQQPKQGHLAASSNQPARLETLEPDSEVELIPGAQTPQQPPQQIPVAPNQPGLVPGYPGQRVFIVHMPVPGYRPGTIGGYQPVYIVAAAPQGNAGFPGNGYQNTVYLDPASGQVVSPLGGYQRGLVQQGSHPGFLLGAPLGLNRPFDLVYQDPNLAYQTGPAVQGPDMSRGAVRLSQLVGLQGAGGRPEGKDAAPVEPKSQALTESKEVSEEPRRRPASAHPQTRTKA